MIKYSFHKLLITLNKRSDYEIQWSLPKVDTYRFKNFICFREVSALERFCSFWQNKWKIVYSKADVLQSRKKLVFLSLIVLLQLTNCDNQGKWENRLYIWWSQWWIFLKLSYALDTHLKFIVWKNHWNATARFLDIKYFSLSSVKNICRWALYQASFFINPSTQILWQNDI